MAVAAEKSLQLGGRDGFGAAPSFGAMCAKVSAGIKLCDGL